jgi:hypothetical protein
MWDLRLVKYVGENIWGIYEDFEPYFIHSQLTQMPTMKLALLIIVITFKLIIKFNTLCPFV